MQPIVVVQLLLSHEKPEIIDRLFSSLERVTYPRESWRIVIRNNVMPGHDALSHVKTHWLSKFSTTLPETVLEVQENNGFAGGHQYLWEVAQRFKPDYVYLLNGDTDVHPDFLTRAVAFAESHPDGAIFQSSLMLGRDRERVNSAGNAMHFLGHGFTIGHKQLPGEIRGDLPMFSASGAAVLVRNSVVEQIGGLFDPKYFLYHEDVDLNWRTRLAGHAIYLVPDSIVFHYYEFARSIKNLYWMERNRWLTNLTHYKLATLICILPAALLMEIGTFLFAVKGGWWRLKLKAWGDFWHLDMWRYIIARRRFVQSLRTVPDHRILALTVGVITHQEVENPVLKYIANPIMRAYHWVLKRAVVW